MAAVRPNPTLPEDLISEILKRLPVKSLVEYQSVSKTWLSLIKHPAFAKAQLRHAIATQTDQTLVTLIRNEKSSISLLDVDSRDIVADLKFPYSRCEVESVRTSYIVGSANGIVCVAVYNGEFCIGARGIYLWNPAIRQSKLIPIRHGILLEALGFGYDEIDNDFKVVRVGCLSCCVAEVYSDNRNVWTSVRQPMDIPTAIAFDVCVNGFLCGIGGCGMIAFDMNKEVMNCGIKLPVINDAHAHKILNCAIKLPVINVAHDDGGDEEEEEEEEEDDDGDDEDETLIIEFNNSVAVIMLMGWDKINMWTLDNDVCLRVGGGGPSWMPMLSIDLGMPAYLIHGYFSNGNLLFVLHKNDVKMWISCNADKKEAKIVPFSVDMADHRYDREIYKYMESLVSLAGFRHVN